MDILTTDFYSRDTLTVARDLLGREIVRVLPDGTRLGCRITETEAYIGRLDKACHAYGYKRTPRTETLFAPPGTAYIYLIYGMYHCLNFVTEAEGEPAAVLIRGAVPAANGDIIAKNRFGCKMEEMSSYQRKKFSQRPGQAVPGTGAYPGGKRTGPHRSGRGAVCLSGRASGPRTHPRGQAHRNRLCGGGCPLPLAVLFINDGPPASSRGPLLFLLSSPR